MRDPADEPHTAQVTARKREHLAVTLSGDAASTLVTGLDDVSVAARALPERDLEAVDLTIDLWGRRLAAPLLISSMTGGVSEAGPINRALAAAAQEHRVALGLGSGRVLLDGAAPVGTFRVRDVAPDVLLLANLGAVQLHEYGPRDCARLVELCEADALVLHLNAVQEAIQPGGQTRFAGLSARIAGICATVDVPVVVKEVGFGMAPADVAALLDAGVSGVDVAGAGGTNWALVEGRRDTTAGAVAAAFADWGWPTARCVADARAVIDAAGGEAVLVGSGGLRHGVDALKVLCLGADLAGVARGILTAAAEGPEAAVRAIGVWCDQLRVGAWAAGAGCAGDLGPRLLTSRTRSPGPRSSSGD